MKRPTAINTPAAAMKPSSTSTRRRSSGKRLSRKVRSQAGSASRAVQRVTATGFSANWLSSKAAGNALESVIINGGPSLSDRYRPEPLTNP